MYKVYLHILTGIYADFILFTFIHSAVQILYEIIEAYHEQDVQILLVNGHPHAMPLINRAGILDLIGHHMFFNDITDAIQSIEQDITYTTFPSSHSPTLSIVKR